MSCCWLLWQSAITVQYTDVTSTTEPPYQFFQSSLFISPPSSASWYRCCSCRWLQFLQQLSHACHLSSQVCGHSLNLTAVKTGPPITRLWGDKNTARQILQASSVWATVTRVHEQSKHNRAAVSSQRKRSLQYKRPHEPSPVEVLIQLSGDFILYTQHGKSIAICRALATEHTNTVYCLKLLVTVSPDIPTCTFV